MMKWAERAASLGGDGESYRVLVGKTEGKRLRGRPRHRWEENIEIYLHEMGWEGDVNRQNGLGGRCEQAEWDGRAM
jgi:hypothetical protein